MTTEALPRTRPLRGPRERTVEEELAFNAAMAGLLVARGYPNLARSYQMLAGLFLGEESRAENLSRSRVWRGIQSWP